MPTARSDQPAVQPQRAEVSATDRHVQLVEQFLAAHGEEALLDALTFGSVWMGMRAHSRFSVKAAMLGATEGVPGTLLLQFRNRRSKGECVEARYMQGEGQQLTIDLNGGDRRAP